MRHFRWPLGWTLWVWVTAVLVAAVPGQTAPPRCRLEVEVQPERPLVGQQVLYSLRILRRHDVSELRWERPLTFPTFRAEWLPGRAADQAVVRAGETYQMYSERRALFPVHPGVLDLPDAAIRCASEEGEEIVAVPHRRLTVQALPTADRPPGFQGIVGPVKLTMTAAPEAIALGESVRLSVVARGPGNLWTVKPRFDPEFEASEFEVFPRPPESARDAGRALSVRRYFAFDVVPREPGVFQLPAVELSFFDPETGRYEVARAEGHRVAVAPARARLPAPSAPEPRIIRTPEVKPRRWTPWLSGPVIGVALGLWIWLRRRRAPDPWHPVEELAAGARNHESLDGRAQAASHALRAALARRLPEARALSAEELAASTPAGGAAHDAATLLHRIESARFAGTPAVGWSPDELDAHLSALRDG